MQLRMYCDTCHKAIDATTPLATTTTQIQGDPHFPVLRVKGIAQTLRDLTFHVVHGTVTQDRTP